MARWRALSSASAVVDDTGGSFVVDSATVTSAPGHVHLTIPLPSGPLRLLQPEEAAELPDDGGVEWAPLVPYWSVLWRSGVALAEELDGAALDGVRAVELGCGLGAPSIAAARAGARVLATDESEEALALLRRNARLNGVELETARVDWAAPAELVSRAPFDLVLAADVLYERAAVAQLLSLLPRLAPRAWIADPGRPAADPFLEQAGKRLHVTQKSSRYLSGAQVFVWELCADISGPQSSSA
jgi:predicted nicotinamide N-methyase